MSKPLTSDGPTSDAISRVGRFLKIITLVQSRSDVTVADLASACAVTERTIHRDLEELVRGGVPIGFDHQAKGYRIQADFFLPPVQLTHEEALALVVLAGQLARAEQFENLGAALRALSKVQAGLPAAVRDEVARISNNVAIRTGPAADASQASDVYRTLQAAIAQRQAVLCGYESRSGESEPFTFHPYVLIFNQRAWYTIGHHSRHNTIRQLKLTRFTSVKPTTEPFEIPASFSVDGFLGNAWSFIRGETDYDIRIRFDPSFGRGIAETRWHKTAETIENPDGTVDFTCRVAGLDEIKWWVLAQGPHATVISPPALAEEVRRLAVQTAAKYPGGFTL